jgi:hypothetical protein
MFQELLSIVLKSTGANGASGANGATESVGANGMPKDFYKVLIGLSLVAKGKGSPLYDPVALLAALNYLSVNEDPRQVTVAEAQQMLDSCPEGIPVPAIGVHSVTIVLSARKKGPESAKDATTPYHVVQFMKRHIAQFGAETVDSIESGESVGSVESGASGASFSVNGVEVRVFQQQSQKTPSAAADEESVLAELRAANAPLYEWLERSKQAAADSAALVISTDVALNSTDGTSDTDDRVMILLLSFFLAKRCGARGAGGGAGKLVFVGCGPIDAAFALYLAERGAISYAISFDGGVNAGQEKDLDSLSHSHRGGPVLLSRSSQVINIGPAITRGLVTPPGIVLLDDASGVKAIAENAFKVAGSPLTTGNLAFRIFVSNCTSFLGSVPELVARARAVSDAPVLTVFQYSRSLALTMVANLLASHDAPIDRAVLSLCISSGYHFPALSAPLPPALARAIDANVNGIETVAALYAFVALGMDARLCAIMAEWDSIMTTTAPLAPLAATGLSALQGLQPPAVSFAVPVFSESGTLLLPQPF